MQQQWQRRCSCRRHLHTDECWKHALPVFFFFLIRKARIKRAGIINLRLESGRLISEQRGRCKKCQRTFPSPSTPGWTLIQVHHSTEPCLSVGLAVAVAHLAPPSEPKTSLPHTAHSMNIWTDRHSFLMGLRDPDALAKETGPLCYQNQDWWVVILRRNKQSSTSDWNGRGRPTLRFNVRRIVAVSSANTGQPEITYRVEIHILRKKKRKKSNPCCI